MFSRKNICDKITNTRQTLAQTATENNVKINLACTYFSIITRDYRFFLMVCFGSVKIELCIVISKKIVCIRLPATCITRFFYKQHFYKQHKAVILTLFLIKLEQYICKWETSYTEIKPLSWKWFLRNNLQGWGARIF